MSMIQPEFIEIEVSVDSDEKAGILIDMLSDIQYPTAKQIQRMMNQLKEEFARKRANEFLGTASDSPASTDSN